MKVHTEFHPLLDALVALNRVHREEMVSPAQRKATIPAEYAQFCCTVVCNIGRQSGKTEYIKRRADADSLVVVTTVKLGELEYGRHTPFQVCSVQQLPRVAAARKFKTIYVDEPSHLVNSLGLARFYELLADADLEQTFILLGEPC